MNNVIQPFTSDAPLYYNVSIWGERGYAVPNFGRNSHTVNETIEEFTTEGGRRLQVIMHHADVDRSDPPSVNTVARMIEFCNRARVVLLGRGVPENSPKFESTKVTSPRRPLKVFPCPYFHVDNRLCQQFATAALACLAELMQTTEVGIGWDITEKLAQLATRYIQRFYVRTAMEYFGLTETEAKAPELDLMKLLDKYTPTANGFFSAEALDDVGTLSWPQEHDLGELARGILVINLPTLGPYPYQDVVTPEGLQPSTTGSGSTAAAATLASGPVIPPFPSNPTFRV